MKRTEIQKTIQWSIEYLQKNGFRLPQFGYWRADTWRDNKDQIEMIKKTMLGWDVTDFGSGKFEELGAVLFTIRNGVLNEPGIGTPYAEKLMLLQPGQRLPIHMHRCKSEDIISRGGGPFKIKLWNALSDGQRDMQGKVKVYCDGLLREAEPGEVLCITNGNSITLTHGLYHSFWCDRDDEAAIIGEVSSINDDNTDNYFDEAVNRFSSIEEDEEIIWILCNEYDKILG